MANTTFLALTNKLLRRINEVEIAQADFASVRGVQALAKDLINVSINEINSQEFEWPFNAGLYTQVLTAGTEQYAFASTVKSVDFDSFHLVKDEVLGTNGLPLMHVSRDVRNRYFKNDDDNSSTDGLNAPTYVWPDYVFGFGVSPSPDAAYSVTFEYYIKPVELSAYSDESTIPTTYDDTIIQGALYHLYMFRDNNEQADRAGQKYKQLINRMRAILINKEDRIRSTMIVRRTSSGGVISNDYFRY